MPARTPQDVDRLFGEYVNAGDLEKAASLYETVAVLVMPDGELRGAAAIRDGLADMLRAKLRLHMDVEKVVQAGEGIAVLYNCWRGTATGPGGDVVEVQGRAIEVVRRQPDGTWRFVLDDPYARG